MPLNKEEVEEMYLEIFDYLESSAMIKGQYSEIKHIKQIIDRFTEPEQSGDSRCLNSLTDYIKERIKYFEQSNKMESISGSQYNDGAIAAYVDILKNIITQEPNESFEIPIMEVYITIHGYIKAQMTIGEWLPWYDVISANAAAIKDCKWVTVESLRKEARFWADDQFPKFGQDYSWVSENGCRDRQYIHSSLIPADCSRAIVRIEHV